MAFIYICGVVILSAIVADIWLRIQEKKTESQ